MRKFIVVLFAALRLVGSARADEPERDSQSTQDQQVREKISDCRKRITAAQQHAAELTGLLCGAQARYYHLWALWDMPPAGKTPKQREETHRQLRDELGNVLIFKALVELIADQLAELRIELEKLTTARNRPLQ